MLLAEKRPRSVKCSPEGIGTLRKVYGSRCCKEIGRQCESKSGTVPPETAKLSGIEMAATVSRLLDLRRENVRWALTF